LNELRGSLQGGGADEATVEQAAAILKAVERVQEETAKAQQEIDKEHSGLSTP
jgi:hypothetical protein